MLILQPDTTVGDRFADGLGLISAMQSEFIAPQFFETQVIGTEGIAGNSARELFPGADMFPGGIGDLAEDLELTSGGSPVGFTHRHGELMQFQTVAPDGESPLL